MLSGVNARAMRVGSDILVSLSLSGGRMLVANYTRGELISDISVPESCDSTYDISEDGQRLACARVDAAGQHGPSH